MTEARPVSILILAGDGVGPEVMPQTRRVLDWFVENRGLDVSIREEKYGRSAWESYRTLVRPELKAAIADADAILFGASQVADFFDIPSHEREPDPLLRFRRDLDLFTNLRPIRIHPELIGQSSLRAEVIEGVDMMIVRELTGGLYFGEPRGRDDDGQRALNTMVYTRRQVERIARAAFEIARGRKGRLCSVDKANVLEVSSFWREIVTQVGAAEFPDVELSHMYVDNAAMQIVRRPTQFDVLLTENLFGDILSDCAAMISGSIGMLPSASIGPAKAGGRRQALYEPIHGSAPDIAGMGIANPLGSILSLAMCFRHTLDRTEDAALLEVSVQRVLGTGARTRDIAAANDSAVSTADMGNRLIDALDRCDRRVSRAV
jgi:3-isopropylmalate dehydrogenase